MSKSRTFKRIVRINHLHYLSSIIQIFEIICLRNHSLSLQNQRLLIGITQIAVSSKSTTENIFSEYPRVSNEHHERNYYSRTLEQFRNPKKNSFFFFSLLQNEFDPIHRVQIYFPSSP